MNPVSAAELAQIQADAVAAACDKTATIYRKTSVTSDGMGGQTPQYTVVMQSGGKTTVAAGISEPSATHLQNFDYLIGSLAAYQIKLPVNTNVAEQDHIMIDGQMLVVQALLTPRSYASLLTVLAAEVK